MDGQPRGGVCPRRGFEPAASPGRGVDDGAGRADTRLFAAAQPAHVIAPLQRRCDEHGRPPGPLRPGAHDHRDALLLLRARRAALGLRQPAPNFGCVFDDWLSAPKDGERFW